jgi:hypothetical protein
MKVEIAPIPLTLLPDDRKPKRSPMASTVVGLFLGAFYVFCAYKFGAAMERRHANAESVVVAAQVLNDYREHRIDYQTAKYKIDGKGLVHPKAIDLIVLGALQSHEGDINGRDETLMQSLDVVDTDGMWMMLNAHQELFDPIYRDSYNEFVKRTMSPEQIKVVLDHQKTTLSSVELKHLNDCYVALGKRDRIANFLFSTTPDECKTAVAGSSSEIGADVDPEDSERKKSYLY